MAIGPLTPENVQHFVLPTKKWYPSKIPYSHHQLRHLISSPSPSIVYFVNEKDVYRLDTSTNKRTHVQTLPFVAKCIATGHGFFCAGDDVGKIAVMRIPEGAQPGQDGLALSDIQHLHSSLANGVATSSTRSPLLAMQIDRPGTDIVNSISIHRLHSEEDDEHVTDDIVAIITNNDLAVRSYSLLRGQDTKIDSFDQPQNHASISPNGKLLIIVGDREMVHFYRRVDLAQTPAPSKPSDKPRILECQWEKLKEFSLHKPQEADHAAYFTTAWSKSGKLCATGSERGYVTVFDVDRIESADGDMDAVIALGPSSRPNTTPGAVRTMCFAPEPWDLLIWAEDRGHVCVADLRHDLVTQQVVNLDSKSPNVTRVALVDSNVVYDAEDGQDMSLIHSAQQISPNGPQIPPADFSELLVSLRARRDARARAGFLGGFSAAASAETNVENALRGLDEEERQILEGIRTTQQREEAISRSTTRPAPRSINYSPSPYRTADHVAANGSSTSEAPGGIPPYSTSTDFSRSRSRQDAAVLGYLRDYMRDGNPSRDRPAVMTQTPPPNASSTAVPPPRRRNSTTAAMLEGMLSSTTNNNNPARESAEAWRTIEAAIGRATGETRPSYASVATQASRTDSRNERISRDEADDYLELPPLRPSHELDSNPSNSSGSTAEPSAWTTADAPSRALDRRTGVTLPTGTTRSRIDASLDPLRALERPGATTWTSRAGASAGTTVGTAGPVQPPQDRNDRDATRRWLGRLDRLELVQGMRAAGFRTAASSDIALYRRMVGLAVPASEQEAREWGAATAGVAVQNGGRTVYVGTEEGVWELTLDFTSRKSWAAVEPA